MCEQIVYEKDRMKVTLSYFETLYIYIYFFLITKKIIAHHKLPHRVMIAIEHIKRLTRQKNIIKPMIFPCQADLYDTR